MLQRTELGVHTVERAKGKGRTLRAQYIENGAHGILIFIINDMFGAVALDLCVMLRGRSRDDVGVPPILEDLNCELANGTACTPDENRDILVLGGEFRWTRPRQLDA